MRSIADSLSDSQTTVGEILDRLGRRSFGGILIIVAALGLLPGISVLTGMVTLLLGAQMLLGYQSPVLPKFLMSKKIDSRKLASVLAKGANYIERLEKWVRPRWEALTRPSVTIVIGLSSIGLGLVIMLPVPFSNFPPAVALILLAVGQFERDGKVIFAGLLMTLASILIGIIFAGVVVHGLSHYFQ